MRFPLLPFLLALALTTSTVSAAQLDARYGLPFANTFLPDVYGGEGQNFDITVTRDNLVYVANSGGVLQYDGQSWNIIDGTRDQIVLSLEADSLDRVWVGKQDDFGVLLADSTGSLKYHSLRYALPDSGKLTGDVWRIRSTPEGVFMMSPKWVLRWRPRPEDPLKGDMQLWSSGEKPTFTLLCSVNGRMYVRKSRHTVQRIAGDSIVDVPGAEATEHKVFVHAAKYDDHTVLLTEYLTGLYLLRDTGLSPYPGEINKALHGVINMGVVRLSDDRFALSTTNSGIFVFDKQGNVLEHILDYHGLSLKILNRKGCVDYNGGVWFPLDYGLIRLDLNMPLGVVGRKAGTVGTILDIRKFHGDLLLSGAAGLFRVKQASEPGRPPEFKRVGGLDIPVWRMETYGSSMLLSTLNGLFLLPPDEHPQHIGSYQGNTSDLAATTDKSLIYTIAELQGLVLFRSTGSGLVEVDTIDVNLDYLPSDIIIDDENSLWLNGRREKEKSLFRAFIDEKHPDVLHFKKYGIDRGLRGNAIGTPFTWRGNLWQFTSEGLFRFHPEQDRFEHMSFGEKWPSQEMEGANQPVEDAKGRLYISPSPYTMYQITPQPDGTFRIVQPLRRAHARRIFAICPDVDPGIAAAGTDDGRLIFFNTDSTVQKPIPDLLFRSIDARDEWHHSRKLSPLQEDYHLQGPVESIRFSYALTSYDLPSRNRYQFRLVNEDDDWSSWTDEPYHDFTNLKTGKYLFEVRGRDCYGNTTAPVAFAFDVLAPWYRRTSMVILWVLLFIALVYAMVRIRIRSLVRHRIRLEQLVRQRTEELQEVQAKEIREMDARKAMEIEAQRLKTANQIAATIAHEFNNPLGVIQGFCDLTELNKEVDPTIRRRLDRIKAQVARMHGLVSKLLRLRTLEEIDYAAGLKILDIHVMDEPGKTEEKVKKGSPSDAPSGKENTPPMEKDDRKDKPQEPDGSEESSGEGV